MVLGGGTYVADGIDAKRKLVVLSVAPKPAAATNIADNKSRFIHPLKKTISLLGDVGV